MDTQTKILTWIDRQYGMRRSWWTDADFHCFEDLPEELREIEMTSWLEVQIENGGPAQLLYNTFNHWRTLLDSCRAGYLRMGLSAQALAVADYELVFSKNADECKRFLEKRPPGGGRGDFVGFMEFAGNRMKTGKEYLFYDESGVFKQKADYIEKHREHLLGLMRTTSRYPKAT